MKNPLRLRATCALLFLFFAATSVHADLPSFKDDIERAESDTKEKKTPSYNDDSSNSAVGTLLWELFKFVWVINNTSVSYSAYPYSDAKFILWPASAQDSPKNHWYVADIQGFHLDGVGTGSWLTFRGNLWRFFGPYFEGSFINENFSDPKYVQNVRLGATFSLIQSNPLSLSLYGQWQAWNGYINRQGGAFGIEAQSFPVKPLVLHARMGFSGFDKFDMTEIEVKAGVMNGPWEFYAGWRWWELLSANGDHVNSYNGIMAGTSYWF